MTALLRFADEPPMIADRHRGPATVKIRFARAWALLLLLCACCNSIQADELTIEIDGIKDPLLSNVRARVDPLQVSGGVRLSPRRLERITEQAERQALLALRPFGYYGAGAVTSMTSTAADSWLLRLVIDPGPPLTVSDVAVEVTGTGASLPELQKWKAEWPLTTGRVVDQTVWETQKQRALDLAEMHGYLAARFAEQTIAVDLERNVASLRLVLECGEQAVMGTINFEQDAVREGILELLPRFREGQAYDAWLLEKFRLALGK